MDHNRKTRVFTPTHSARLQELLVLLGCGNEIAPFDADALATRAGELIAKVRSYQPKPLTRVEASALNSSRASRISMTKGSSEQT
jgi:hypothetical protein